MHQLEAAGLKGRLVINDVIYAELSVGFRDIGLLDRALLKAGVEVEHVPRAALFLAGQVFKLYRDAGGARTGVLPDFFIGAHAAVTGRSLLTRDLRRYRTYFPRLELICP